MTKIRNLSRAKPRDDQNANPVIPAFAGMTYLSKFWKFEHWNIEFVSTAVCPP